MPAQPNVLLVSIDTQIDFVMENGLLPVPGAEAIIVPGIKYLADLDPDEVKAALFTFDTHTREKYLGSLENLGQQEIGIPGFPLHCEVGTKGWANVFNIEMVAERIPTFTLEKGVFDMWEEDSSKVHVRPRTPRSGLRSGRPLPRDVFFHGYSYDIPKPLERGYDISGVDTVRVMGVASDFCVNWAINGFLKRGFTVEVIEHLTAGIRMDILETVAKNFPGKVRII